MAGAPGHRVERCKHGTVVGQCRCMGPHTVQVVACPVGCPYVASPQRDPRAAAGSIIETAIYDHLHGDASGADEVVRAAVAGLVEAGLLLADAGNAAGV